MNELVAALGPAFAAGFAVQRLLEILDPIVEKIFGAENKKIVLGVVSLVMGWGLAFGAKLTVLNHFKIVVNSYLDYLVAGLLISAGTEGFNSILKFLSYKKEEKKAEAAAEKISIARRLSLIRGETIWNSMENAALAPVGEADNTMEGIMPKKFLEDGTTLDEGLEASLKAEIKRRFKERFTEVNWKKRAFSELTNDVDDPKVTVLHATRNIADEADRFLPKNVIRNLQRGVDLTTTPEDALPKMRRALDFSKPQE